MPESTAMLLQQHFALLTERAVEQQYQRQPTLWQPYGDEGRLKSVRDMGYHLTYLIEALQANAPQLFLEYLAWVQELFHGLTFPPDVLSVSLETLEQAVIDCVPAVPERQAALTLLQEARVYLQHGLRETPSYVQGERPIDELARAYLQALLQSDRRTAQRLIMDALQAGITVKELYREVFERTQREIGRLWQANRISVAQEHFCTAATQMIMSQLYPYLFTGERKARRAITFCINGELHEIGARMVSDYLEMEGWDSYYFGANTPPESVVRSVQELRPHIVAISATMTFHVSRVAALIQMLRERCGGDTFRIIVGGYPFNLVPELWQTVGADGYAPNAELAVPTAESLVAYG